MRNAIFALALAFSASAHAADAHVCDISSFPDFWADAEDRVSELKAMLKREEQKNPHSQATAAVFRQSLGVCKAKRDMIFKGATTSHGGILGQTKCEAILICARAFAINIPM